MALSNFANTLISASHGFSKLPIIRQGALLIGLSLSIAIGFSVVLWTKDYNYRPIYSYLSPQETSDILDSLDQNHIPYKLDNKSNTILVPEDEVYKVRLQIASQGLPKNNGAGFEMLDKDLGIGTSRFMENARFKRALEGELSRTIGTLETVKSARVHLALPKESVFVNDNRKPSASVVLDLSSGSSLDKKQALAIMQLVASSVPNMQPSDVSVIDQHGHLLSYDINSDQFAMTREQLDYTNKIESAFEKRIETMLIPLLGDGKIRVRVNADVDFNKLEQTQENFLPNSSVVRSEQIVDESNPKNGSDAGGIPGTLSNQPPQTPTLANNQIANSNPNATAQPTAGQGAGTEEKDPLTGQTVKKQQMRNFEIGKTISHSNIASGKITKLSIAIVADNKMMKDPKTGKSVSTPLSKQDIDNITQLAENAVGFDSSRGDKISVVNLPFVSEGDNEIEVKAPFWKEPWFLDLIRMSGGGLVLIVLLLMVLRPTLKSLANVRIEPQIMPKNLLTESGEGLEADKVSIRKYSENSKFLPAMSGNSDWESVKMMASEDPKRMAQVMKSWLGESDNG